MSKSFISILGTNDYLECCHSFEDKISEQPVKYVQEDLIKFFCSDFDENDEIRIFLTKDATEKNWEDNGHKDKNHNPILNIGLKNRLNNLKLKCKINPIPIKEGFNENEIWDTFQIIYDTFKNGEEVIVDITHSFRFLPMLLTTLLNYAKYQKNIIIKGIYYAAFESLGTPNDIRNLPVEKRIVPIFDLTSLSRLQDWTVASFDFINNANVSRLRQLIHNEKYNETTNYLPNKVVTDLEKLIHNISFCRGNELLNSKFDELKNSIMELKNLSTLPKPFSLLIDELYKKVKNFNNNLPDLTIGIAEWCYYHNYFQQLVTLLQEFTITLIINDCDLDLTNRDYRRITSQAFRIKAENINENDWEEPSRNNPELVNKILENRFLKKLSDSFQTLTELRNDINHSGFTSNARNVAKLKSKIEKIIDNYRTILK